MQDLWKEIKEFIEPQFRFGIGNNDLRIDDEGHTFDPATINRLAKKKGVGSVDLRKQLPTRIFYTEASGQDSFVAINDESISYMEDVDHTQVENDYGIIVYKNDLLSPKTGNPIASFVPNRAIQPIVLAMQRKIDAAIDSSLAGLIKKPTEDGLLDSFTLAVWEDPVTTADGQTYERDKINTWLETKDTSPRTLLKLENKTLTPNPWIKRCLKSFEDEGVSGMPASIFLMSDPDAEQQGDDQSLIFMRSLWIVPKSDGSDAFDLLPSKTEDQPPQGLSSVQQERAQKVVAFKQLIPKELAGKTLAEVTQEAAKSKPEAGGGAAAAAGVGTAAVGGGTASALLTDGLKSDDEVATILRQALRSTGTGEIVKDPVVARDGCTYERAFIEEAFAQGRTQESMNFDARNLVIYPGSQYFSREAVLPDEDKLEKQCALRPNLVLSEIINKLQESFIYCSPLVQTSC